MALRRARTPAPLTVLVLAVLVLATVTGAAGCSPGAQPPTATPIEPATQPAPEQLIEDAVAEGLPSPTLTVLGRLRHDTGAWTQGLEIADGRLYEGTGRTGHSQLRELDPATGRLLRATGLPASLYGEGITVVGPRIWQLTWRDGVAVEWDRGSLLPGRRVSWDGEGWGLCRTADGPLVASDGTDRLRLLDPGSLRVDASVPVRVNGRPLRGLNELECAAGAVWANVFETDWLVRIELGRRPADGGPAGTVTAAVRAAGLLDPDERAAADVLNGIAAVPGTDEFLLTGKYWPTIFRVRFEG